MNPPRKREPIILSVPESAEPANAVPQRFKAMVLLSAWCGPRWGEVPELHRKDIGAGCEVVRVEHGVTRNDRQTRVDTTRSGRARTVTVPPHIRKPLKHPCDVHIGQDADALLYPNTMVMRRDRGLLLTKGDPGQLLPRIRQPRRHRPSRRVAAR
jgi:hypothetical protein